jgi:hypothetical protein
VSRDQIHILMSIHEGEYLGQTLEPIYVLLNGIGLLWMLVTGGGMLVHQLKQTLQKVITLNTEIKASKK